LILRRVIAEAVGWVADTVVEAYGRRVAGDRGAAARSVGLADIGVGAEVVIITGNTRGGSILAKSGGAVAGIGGAGVVVVAASHAFLLAILVAAVPILVVPVVAAFTQVVRIRTRAKIWIAASRIIVEVPVSASVAFSEGIFDFIFTGGSVAVTIGSAAGVEAGAAGLVRTAGVS